MSLEVTIEEPWQVAALQPIDVMKHSRDMPPADLGWFEVERIALLWMVISCLNGKGQLLMCFGSQELFTTKNRLLDTLQM